MWALGSRSPSASSCTEGWELAEAAQPQPPVALRCEAAVAQPAFISVPNALTTLVEVEGENSFAATTPSRRSLAGGPSAVAATRAGDGRVAALLRWWRRSGRQCVSCWSVVRLRCRVAFRILLRLLLFVLPLVTAVLLFAFPAEDEVAKGAAILTALVALSWVLPALVRALASVRARKNSSDALAEDLTEFGWMFSGLTGQARVDFVEAANSEERAALQLLGPLLRRKFQGLAPLRFPQGRTGLSGSSGSSSKLSKDGRRPGMSDSSIDTHRTRSMSRSRSNFSVGSRRLPQLIQSSSSLGWGAWRSPQLRPSSSNISTSSKTLKHSVTDISVSSFTDFNWKQAQLRPAPPGGGGGGGGGGSGGGAPGGAGGGGHQQEEAEGEGEGEGEGLPRDRGHRHPSLTSLDSMKAFFTGSSTPAGGGPLADEEDFAQRGSLGSLDSTRALFGDEVQPARSASFALELELPGPSAAGVSPSSIVLNRSPTTGNSSDTSSTSGPYSSQGSLERGNRQQHLAPGGAVRFRLPNGAGSFMEDENFSEAAQTYVSNDLVAAHPGGGDMGETVSAEVVNLGIGPGGTSRVRIEFRSQCLRTQNEWQRQLLSQQRSLLDAVSTELEDARRVLDTRDELKETQKELLRGFRKIVTRHIDIVDLEDEGVLSCVTVFVLEEDDDLRTQAQELCRILQYTCHAFGNLEEGRAAIAASQVQHLNESGFARSITQASSSSGQTKSIGPFCVSSEVFVVLLGASMLSLSSAEKWGTEVFVALASEAEDFEEVGRALVASGEAEVRERLRVRGISEYLLHPLSLDGLQNLVKKALQRRFGDDYLLVRLIGRGSTGVVHCAKRLSDGEVFALKEINTRRMGKKAREVVRTEVEMLRALRWPTVLFCVDAWADEGNHLQLVLMPLLGGGCLQQRIDTAAGAPVWSSEGTGLLPPRRPRPPPAPARGAAATPAAGGEKIAPQALVEWYAQALHGLCYLHWRGVLHRDLKPLNLFLGADGRTLRLGDLGSAVRLPGPGPHPSRWASVSGGVTTLGYTCPETLSRQVACTASDLWALGVSFYEALALKALVPAEVTAGELAESHQDPGKQGLLREFVDSALGVLSSLVSGGGLGDAERGLVADIERLLQEDPLQRPTAAELVVRPASAQGLRAVLTETEVFSEPSAWAAHFEEFKEVLAQSNKVATLIPLGETQLPDPLDFHDALAANRRGFRGFRRQTH